MSLSEVSEQSFFKYGQGRLMAEGVELQSLAEELGTPLYVYSKAAFVQSLSALKTAFQDIPHLICYSVKCSSNLALLRLAAQHSLGADVVSGGELFRALRAGLEPGLVVFSGVGKSRSELQEALRAGILMFNVESEEELELLAELAAASGRKAPVALRVNPDVDPRTHRYISTGLKENKFGLSPAKALALYERLAGHPHLEARGLACHIGSQLTDLSPLLEAAAKMIFLAGELARSGLALQYLDLGGGFGIRYRSEPEVDLSGYAKALRELLAQGPPLRLILEPGRFVAGNSGLMLTRVLYNKENGGRHFVVVDAGLNDLIRPSLYEAWHDIIPLKQSSAEPIICDVVGPICESADFLAKERPLAPVKTGELVAVMSAGAYGFSMSSNYNSRPRAAEVLVDGHGYQIIRERESYEDLIRGEL